MIFIKYKILEFQARKITKLTARNILLVFETIKTIKRRDKFQSSGKSNTK